MSYDFTHAFSHLVSDSDEEEDITPEEVQPQEPQSQQPPPTSPLPQSPSPPISPATPSPLPPLSPPPPLEPLVVEKDIINISSSEDEYEGEAQQEPDENAMSSNLTLKLQDGHRKHLKEYQITKFSRIINLKKMYADDFGIDLNSMKLWFDGDPVDDDETPESLDIEDGCVLDVMISIQK